MPFSSRSPEPALILLPANPEQAVETGFAREAHGHDGLRASDGKVRRRKRQGGGGGAEGDGGVLGRAHARKGEGGVHRLVGVEGKEKGG